MTPTIIVLIALAVIFIVVSCFIGMDDKQGDNFDISDIPEDKKQTIDSMVNDYLAKSVGNKGGNLKPLIEKEIVNKIKNNNDKLDKENKKSIDKLNNKLKEIEKKIDDSIKKLDSTGDKKAKELDQRTESKIAEIDEHTAEVIDSVAKSREEIDSTYALILEKEKEIRVSLNLMDEYKKGLEALKNELDKRDALAVSQASKSAEVVEETEEAEVVSEVEEVVPDTTEEEIEEAEEIVEEEIVEEESDEVEVPEEDIEDSEDEIEDSEEKIEEAEDGEDDGQNRVISISDRISRAAADDSDEDEDEEEKEDVSDVEQTESLDEILAVEGISLEGGNTEENVMGMYHAGFSILEISKLLDIGVGEVKYVIDKHQGE
jgi:DNA repair exonuclease SbcCD ATPase subunit